MTIKGDIGIIRLLGITDTIQNFKKVVQIEFGDIGYFYNLTIAKDVGLIRFYNPKDQTFWELINYKINSISKMGTPFVIAV